MGWQCRLKILGSVLCGVFRIKRSRDMPSRISTEGLRRRFRNIRIRRSSAVFLGLAPSWHRDCWRRWDLTGADSTPPRKSRNTPALHRLPNAAEKPSGCIVASPARSLSNKASTSLPDNQSHCDWARAYYDHKKAEGKGHHTAIRALAYRWIRIIYRCWKDRVPYNEQRYMESLRRKRPSWLASVADSEFLNAKPGLRSKNNVSS